MKIKAIILLAILVLSTLSPVMAYSIGDQVSYNMTKGSLVFGENCQPMGDPINFPYTQKHMFWGKGKINQDHDYLLLDDDLFSKIEYEVIHDKFGQVGLTSYETLYNYTVGGTITHYHPKEMGRFPFEFFYVNVTSVEIQR
jgi:hypothetical protein